MGDSLTYNSKSQTTNCALNPVRFFKQNQKFGGLQTMPNNPTHKSRTDLEVDTCRQSSTKAIIISGRILL